MLGDTRTLYNRVFLPRMQDFMLQVADGVSIAAKSILFVILPCDVISMAGAEDAGSSTCSICAS